MAKKMLIDATHAEETRVVVADGNKVEEFDFESENKRQLAGNIYLAKVTRVEPSLQAAFIDYGGNRHGFLAFSEIHPDYYQIPVADREALLAEERELAMAQAEAEEEEEREGSRSSRGRGRGRTRGGRAGRSRGRVRAQAARDEDAVTREDVSVTGMDVVDLDLPGDDVDGQADDAAAHSAALGVDGNAPDVPDSAAPAGMDDAGADGAGADAGANGAGADDAPADSSEAGAPARAERQGSDAQDDSTAEEPAETEDSVEPVEAVSDDDVAEEIRRPRKVRPRKYKIQEVIKVRQILLVQVVKEERGNKGAALTTYLSLAGRYCVLMPNTARGGGISRKITNAADRKKLKQIAAEIEVPEGAGLIIRTAGAQRTRTEIKRDYEYLQRLWEQIRELTLKSIAPAKIYEEGDLIKRSIRDLYNKEIDEVLVEGEAGYRTAKDFMKMIMPSHAKNVKLYKEPLPLFARFQVEGYLASMFNPTVQLKSGGYIVIGVTEALVAIDVNSGRATKEGSIEETALKTNLEAAEEVARQLRLRDLAGLIVIDFIDMEERKNNAAVEKRFKEKLKHDRARIQVGRISGFGLLEMSRQRLRPGMIEATTQPCPHCHGTGLIRSNDSLALSILRQLEEEGTRRRTREVLVKAPVAIANYLMNEKREHVAGIEAAYGLSVRVEGDAFLVSPDFSIEKFKTASRTLATAAAPVVSVDASLMADIDENAAEEAVEDAPAGEEAPAPRKRRRRRRRRRSSGTGQGAETAQARGAENGADHNGADHNGADHSPENGAEDASANGDDAASTNGRTRDRTRVHEAPEGDDSRDQALSVPSSEAPAGVTGDADTAAREDAPGEAAPKAKTRKVTRSRRKSTASAAAAGDDGPKASDSDADATAEEAAAPKRRASRRKAAGAAKSEAAHGGEDAGENPEGKAPRKRAGSGGRTRARKSDPAPAGDADKAAEPPRDAMPDATPDVPTDATPDVPPDAGVETRPEPGGDSAEPQPAPVAAAAANAPVEPREEEPKKPRKKGWWSLR